MPWTNWQSARRNRGGAPRNATPPPLNLSDVPPDDHPAASESERTHAQAFPAARSTSDVQTPGRDPPRRHFLSYLKPHGGFLKNNPYQRPLVGESLARLAW